MLINTYYIVTYRVIDHQYIPGGKSAIAGCLSNKAAFANVYSDVPFFI